MLTADGQVLDQATGQTRPMTAGEAAAVSNGWLDRNQGQGVYAVAACLLDVYDARVRQLETFIAFDAAGAIAQAAGWN